MSPEITPEHARALYEEMNPQFERHQAPPELERVGPYGRLRVRAPLQTMTWTFPARAAATHEHVCMNVGLTMAGWGLLHVADEIGATAGALSVAAVVFPGARQSVTVALDGQRIILGVVSLTGLQSMAQLEAPQDPGLVEALHEHRTTASGALHLPLGPALFHVVDLADRRCPSSREWPRVTPGACDGAAPDGAGGQARS